MRSSIFLPIYLLATSSSALVLPRQDQSAIATIAGGGPPNGPAPVNLSPAAIAAFSGVNFLENLEAAFFLEGLQNLSSSSWSTVRQRDHAIDVVKRVQAQEVIHIETAEAILRANNAPTFQPCKYSFPVSTPEEFFSLANIITSVGIGAVIDVASNLALTDPHVVPGPTSILAVEARHDAFFRHRSGVSDIPNPAPFDTRISATYALNLAAPFIVPGSCPSMPKFPAIPPLMVAQEKGEKGKKSQERTSRSHSAWIYHPANPSPNTTTTSSPT